jgi:hypothetical protein
VVHEVDPLAEVASVDVHPLVLALRHGLLGVPVSGDRPAASAVLGCGASLGGPPQGDRVDLTRPVGLLLLGMLHFITDGSDARDAVDHLTSSLAPGSHLVISHLTGDFPSPELRSAVEVYERSGLPTRLRSRAEVEGLLAGLDVLDPGVELVSAWRRAPDEGLPAPPEQVACWGAVAQVR